MLKKCNDTDDVDDDVFGPGGAPVGGHLTDVHYGLRVVTVDVEYRSVDDTGHVRTVRRRTREPRVCSETDLTHAALKRHDT